MLSHFRRRIKTTSTVEKVLEGILNGNSSSDISKKLTMCSLIVCTKEFVYNKVLQ